MLGRSAQTHDVHGKWDNFSCRACISVYTLNRYFHVFSYGACLGSHFSCSACTHLTRMCQQSHTLVAPNSRVPELHSIICGWLWSPQWGAGAPASHLQSGVICQSISRSYKSFFIHLSINLNFPISILLLFVKILYIS